MQSKVFFGILLGGVAMAMAVPAGAQQLQGDFYGSVGVGVALFNDADDISSTGNSTAAFNNSDPEISADTGLTLNAAIGWEHETGIRIEGQYLFAGADLDEINSNLGTADLDGDVNLHGGLVNVLYEHDFDSLPISPFVGGGIGFAHVSADVSENLSLQVVDISGNDTVFAYQGIVGVAYDLSERIVLQGDYRYLGTSDPTIENTTIEVGVHQIGVSARLKF